MLKFRPVYNFRLNCLDNVIANIAINENIDYQLSLADAWNFRFIKNNSSRIGDGIKIDSTNNFEFLSLFHQLDMQYLNTKIDTELLISIWDSSIYICPCVDAFFCYWDKCYGVHHNLHTIIVEWINPVEKYVYITDPFYNKYFEKLSFKDFDNMVYGGYIFYRNKKNNHIQKNDINKIIFDRMFKLSEELNERKLLAVSCKDIDFQIEKNGYRNVWNCPVVYNTGRIKLSILRYCEMLEYIIQKFNFKFYEILVELSEIAEIWGTIQSLWAKVLLKNEFGEIEYIQNRINYVSDKEIVICDKLMNLYK